MAAPSAAAAAGAAAAALLQRQLLQGTGGTGGSEQGWSEHQTGDGRKFFHNEETGVSQWEKPDSLMTDSERIVNSTAWKQYRIWDGRIFYHNKETKVSCWSMPPELRKLRGESTGLDDRPLPETRAEQRQAFQEFLKERQVDATWDWRRVQELARDAPQAEGVSEPVQKQVFAELLSLALKRGETEARAKARNAAVALERLVEERFADPDALGTTHEEAARILGDEEAWTLIKSDVRRDEVFQTVMERLEEKHEKHRADKRAERVVRLQRLMATDPELRRPRMRWKDATAVLARRDELQEEEPPIEALRVWASMRELRQPATREVDPKNKAQADFFRDERKRRDAFVLSMKELAAAERFTMGTSWAQLEEMLQASGDQRIAGLREGEGAVAMELFDEFVEELKLKGAEAYAGVEPAPPPPEPIVEPPRKRQRSSRLSADVPLPPVKQELHPVKMEKEEEEDDTNALDALIAAASSRKGVATKTEAVKSEPVKTEAVKTEKVKAEEEDDDDDTEEEEDPLMGAALKAAKVKEEMD